MHLGSARLNRLYAGDYGITVVFADHDGNICRHGNLSATIDPAVYTVADLRAGLAALKGGRR